MKQYNETLVFYRYFGYGDLYIFSYKTANVCHCSLRVDPVWGPVQPYNRSVGRFKADYNRPRGRDSLLVITFVRQRPRFRSTFAALILLYHTLPRRYTCILSKYVLCLRIIIASDYFGAVSSLHILREIVEYWAGSTIRQR